MKCSNILQRRPATRCNHFLAASNKKSQETVNCFLTSWVADRIRTDDIQNHNLTL